MYIAFMKMASFSFSTAHYASSGDDWPPPPLLLGGSTPYNGLYEEAPAEMDTFLTLKVYERVRISLVGVYERVQKSVISFCKSA